jgi:hypothetical protein
VPFFIVSVKTQFFGFSRLTGNAGWNNWNSGLWIGIAPAKCLSVVGDNTHLDLGCRYSVLFTACDAAIFAKNAKMAAMMDGILLAIATSLFTYLTP